MPNSKPTVPSYTQHSYAYWANFYASPSDLVISKATGSNPVAPVGSSRNSLANLNKDIQGLNYKGAVIGTIKAGPEARKASGLTREMLDPKVQQLYDQTLAAEAKAGTGGEDPSFLTRTFDVLSRLNYAIAGAYKQTITEEQKANGSTDINDLSYIPVVGSSFWKSLTQGQALWDGLAGYNKVTFSGVLDQAHPEMNDVAKGVLGFALDVGMDPTTYIGVGAIKNVSAKVIGEGAKIASDAEATANHLADFFKADGTRVDAVHQMMVDSWEKSGLAPTNNFFTSLKSVDFTDPGAVQKFLTSGVGEHPDMAKGAAKAGLSDRAKTTQVVTKFLEATSTMMHEHLYLTHLDELKAAALKDGTLIDTTAIAPETMIRTLTYEALTMPEAEVVSKINTLHTKRGILESQISTAKKELTGREQRQILDGLQGQKAAVNAELKTLINETRIDMGSQDVLTAIRTLTESDRLSE